MARIIEKLQQLDTIYPDHGTDNLAVNRALMRARLIAQALKVENFYDCFQGKTYIEVGCGSKTWLGDGRYPALVTLAAVNEANAYGIDLFPGPDDAPYHHIQMDIVMPKSLDLGELCGVREAHIVVCNGLVDLDHSAGTSPALRRSREWAHADLQEFYDRLWNAANRVLVPGGLFMYNQAIYIKVDDQWIHYA